MKSHSEVQKTREHYHREPAREAVHRSSLLVPELADATASISFLNHFLIKRGYADVACKISGISEDGNLTNAVTVPVSEPRVYSIKPSELLGERSRMYMIEFFCAGNLFVPFPAVIINHQGNGFINSVHSYNRVFNDVFENDAINAINAPEASIDVELDDKYEPFFVFSSGILPFKGNISVHLDGSVGSIAQDFAIDIPKLSYHTINFGDVFSSTYASRSKVLRIVQPPQFMFYGRLLAGIRERSTGAFSANHSFYDSSSIEEYWKDASPSFRTYPVIPGFGIAIRMYPIMSPGTLEVTIEASDTRTGLTSTLFEGHLVSPGNKHLEVNISNILSEKHLEPSAISVKARAASGDTPTRISHQIVYYDQYVRSKLQASINVSLASLNAFQPAEKKSQSWGQIILGKDYRSGMGFSFNSSSGEASEVYVQFFGKAGCFLEKSFLLAPGTSWCVTGEELTAALSSTGMVMNEFEPVWYFARSLRPDLTGYSSQSHLMTGHTSGEHSF